MKERINWIDWAKAMAVCTVVFCHLPQSQDWFYYRYLQAVIIVIFFFLSGYLKKDRGSTRATWQKYWHGLIAPYILYNALVYPYWLAKYFLKNGSMPDLFHALRPVFGALLLENDNSFCEPLNGPLWYLPAILIMHMLIDLCRKTKYQHVMMMTLCAISFGLYTANKYWFFAPNLTLMGLMRNLPFYYIGYVMGQRKIFRDDSPKYGLPLSISCLAVSLLLFQWHLQAYFAGNHITHIILFYPVNIGFLFGVLYACKVLGTYKWPVVTNLSIGTLVIIGLHMAGITVANTILEHLQGLSTTICYQWYEALPVALIIVALLYPIITLTQKHAPMLLGKRR